MLKIKPKFKSPAIYVKLRQQPCCDPSSQMRLQGLPESLDYINTAERIKRETYKIIRVN